MSEFKDSEVLRYANECVTYDPDTGLITYKDNESVKKVLRGTVANSTYKASGYKRIVLNKQSFLQHRLAWLLHYGKWPEGDIDHINGKRNDNRIKNLRDTSKNLNMENQREAKVTNKTGFLGVRKRNRKANPYNAQIKVNGKTIDLGVYKTAEEAHAAYVVAKRKYHTGCTI